MKLLITGGHFTPALAVIEYLQSHSEYKKNELVFVGRQYANRGDQNETLEYREITRHHIPFIHLDAGRMTRVASVASLRNILRVPSGFFQARKIISDVKPDVVLSFGGYVALPIAYAAHWAKIPVYTHEQTIRPGLANRLICRVAKRVFISFPDSKKYIQSDAVVLSGNPVRSGLLQHSHVDLNLPSHKPMIFITGGSLGSHSVNIHIERILPELLQHYSVVHQTGNVQQYGDYGHLEAIKANLPKEQQSHYLIRAHFTTEEMGYIMRHAQLVISRSGANTFFDLLFLKKPAILIPLPWSAYDEQRHQAKLFAQAGTGEIFEQDHPSHELLQLVKSMMPRLETYKHKFSNLTHLYKHDAAQIIVETILHT